MGLFEHPLPEFFRDSAETVFDIAVRSKFLHIL